MDKTTKILFSLFQKLDYRDKENSGKKKLIGILIAYIFSNTVLSYNYFFSFDERSFVIFTLTANLFLIALIVLNDFDNLFLANKNYELLNSLPLKSSQLFSAKFLSAILYILFFIIAASIPQIIFFYFFEHSLLKTALYLFTNVMFCYFSIGVLILFYIFILNYFTEKAGILLNFLQFFFFIFIFYSSTLSSKAINESGKLFNKESILKYDFVRFLPQTFFSNSIYNLYYLIFCIALSGIVFFLLFKFTSKNYIVLLNKVSGTKKKSRFKKPELKSGFINNFINKFILKNNEEIASYNLVKFQLKNSRFLRLKYIPFLFVPILFVIIGIVSDIPQLLFFNKSFKEGSFFKTVILVLSPSITFTLLMCSRLLISNTKILDENTINTEWIYDSLPIENKSLIIKGANKFIYINFILPAILLILILLSFKADFSTVMINIIFVSSAIYFINSVYLIFDKTFPFTLESTKFNSATKFLEVLFSMFLGMILFLIQIFVFQNIIFVIISIMILIIISLFLNRK